MSAWYLDEEDQQGVQNPLGFGEFYEDHYDMVYRAAYGVTHNPQDAQDVVQNVFLNLLEREQGCELTGNIRGYLYQAAIREALHLIQSRNHAQARNEAYYEDWEAQTGRSDLDQAVLDRLRDGIATLKPEHVDIVVLRYEFGYDEYEIAQFLGCSRATVGVKLFRIHGKLKKFMDENPNTANSAGGRS